MREHRKMCLKAMEIYSKCVKGQRYVAFSFPCSLFFAGLTSEAPLKVVARDRLCQVRRENEEKWAGDWFLFSPTYAYQCRDNKTIDARVTPLCSEREGSTMGSGRHK